METFTALEQWFEWQGICIEAQPTLVNLLRRQRRCAVVQAVVGDDETESVSFWSDPKNQSAGRIVAPDEDVVGFFIDSLSNPPNDSQASIQQLPTRSLASILDELCAPSEIDYLSLDVEGAEWRVLRNFPFDRYRFKVLSIERPSSELCERLTAWDYVLAPP